MAPQARAAALCLALAACSPGPSGSAAAPEPRTATYAGILDAPVTLAGGRYEGEPYADGGASRPVVTLLREPRAKSDLDGDGVADVVVVLALNTGGSGTFMYIAVVTSANGNGQNPPAILLGDRVRVTAVEVVAGEIRVELLDFAPGDAMCCPTLPRRAAWILRAGELVAPD